MLARVAYIGALLLTVSCRSLSPEYDRQERYAEALTPALDEVGEPLSHTRPIRVRVHADEAFRRETLNWQKDIEAQFARANAFIGPRFGVHFEVTAIEAWPATVGASSLCGALDVLMQHDNGAGVDLVIGFVTALPTFTTAFHNLGCASGRGGYFLLRGMSSVAERDHLEARLRLLSADERNHVLRQRLRHKALMVLLHEWGHTLGAIHTVRSDTIMAPKYSADTRGFDPANVVLARLALEPLVGPADDPRPPNERAMEHLERVGPGPWLRDAYTKAKLRLESAGRRPPENRLSSAVAEGANEAMRLAREGFVEEAWASVEGLARELPDEPSVARAQCFVGARRSVTSTTAAAACRRVADERPDDPLPLIWLAQGYAKDHPDRAIELLTRAAERLDPRDPRWYVQAEAYLAVLSLSRAEEALARAPDSRQKDELAQEILLERRRSGLPRGSARFGVQPGAEHRYLIPVRRAHDALDGDRPEEAEVFANQIARRYSGTPASLTLRCRLELTGGRFRAAKKLCRRSLELDEEGSLTHFLLGCAEMLAGNGAAARRHLLRAQALDPRLEPGDLLE